ncbi:MAG: DUF3370 family protein [bacterium]|nr:DUF3370 family protein [bacterium]
MSEGFLPRSLLASAVSRPAWRPRLLGALPDFVTGGRSWRDRLDLDLPVRRSSETGRVPWATPEAVTHEALPGGLDAVPVLNSNHPEIVLGTGIAISTAPGPADRHLDFDFKGPFGFFSAHQNGSSRRLVQGLVLSNPGPEPVTVKVERSAATSNREAPFRDRPGNTVFDPDRQHTSGPGDATASSILRGISPVFTAPLRLEPGEVKVIWQRPLDPGVASMVQMQFHSDGPVHMAELFGTETFDSDRATRMWLDGNRVPADPRDRPPTPPGAGGVLIYGRVAGIQQGETWRGVLTAPGKPVLELDDRPEVRAFAIDTVVAKTLGTGQVQSAPLLRRYADSAYASHGNYGVTYELELPLVHAGEHPLDVALFFDSPGKPGTGPSRVFRGEVEVREGARVQRFHISQRSGDLGDIPIFEARMRPGDTRQVKVRLVIPADITPAQALRLQTRPTAQVNRLRMRRLFPDR